MRSLRFLLDRATKPDGETRGGAGGAGGAAWSQSCAASMSARSCRCVQGATGAAGGGGARLMSRGRERAGKGGRLNLSITQERRRYAHLPPSTPSLPPPGRTRDSAKWRRTLERLISSEYSREVQQTGRRDASGSPLSPGPVFPLLTSREGALVLVIWGEKNRKTESQIYHFRTVENVEILQENWKTSYKLRYAVTALVTPLAFRPLFNIILI